MKIGLALGGGGAKGSYQIGVFKALSEANLLDQITYVSGTSIGAVNAALFMANKSHDEMIKVWKKITKKLIFKEKRKDKLGLYSVNPIKDELTNFISANDITNSLVNGYVITARLTKKVNYLSQIRKSHVTKETFHINTHEQPLEVIAASASIPIIFGATKISDNYYVDGGLLNNHPVQVLIDAGCDLIINVPLDRFFKEKNFRDTNLTMLDFGGFKDFRKTYLFDGLDTVNFSNKQINRRYLYGYLVTKHMIDVAVKQGLIDSDNNFKLSDTFTYLKVSKKDDVKILKQVKKMINNNSNYI